MNQGQTFNDPFGLVKPNRKAWYWQPRAKEPQQQYPVYTPTLNEPWITVRFIPAKPPEKAIINDYHDMKQKMLAEMSELPRLAVNIARAAKLESLPAYNCLRRMFNGNEVIRTKENGNWKYSITQKA
jgi:hypothetical protein